MTTFDQMAYTDPVGAAACADAGRFAGHTIAAVVEDALEDERCGYCGGSGVDHREHPDDATEVVPCPVCTSDDS